jgi:hypothetical protein
LFFIESLCFADDSIIFLNLRNDLQLSKLQQLFSFLGEITGLKIQPSKSKILHFNSFNLVEKDRLRSLGTIVESFTHLGLEIAKDVEKTISRTYHRALKTFRKAVTAFIEKGGLNLLLHRKILLQAIISSRLQHIYRVLPPTNETIKEIEKWTRKALWLKTFQGNQYGRPKVAADRLESPLSQGGLGILSVKNQIFRSQVNSWITNIRYLAQNEECTWNRLTNAAQRSRSILFLGSKRI